MGKEQYNTLLELVTGREGFSGGRGRGGGGAGTHGPRGGGGKLLLIINGGEGQMPGRWALNFFGGGETPQSKKWGGT